MVSRWKFNKIKKEKPDSRIGKRTWEEQKARNDLATVLIKARKKGVKTSIDNHIDEKFKLKQENMELKKENKVLQETMQENMELKKENNALEETIFELKPHSFEKFSLNSGIDDTKLQELQQADLVLVYRDNNLYGDMSLALKNLVLKYLVEHKCCGSVYCLSIPQGTENLNDEDLEILRKILTTCNCMTDYTVSNWTGIESKHIPESQSSDIQKFLGITKNLEQKFIEKGVDKVYIFVSSTYRDWNDYSIIRTAYTIFDHGHLCQREDGGIYFLGREDFQELGDEDKKGYIEDAKRFWKNMFPNLDVEFIDQDKVNGENCSQYNVEGSVLIADRHAYDKVEDFSGQKILYAGANFEPQGGIEIFVNENDYKYVGSVGEAIAETVMLDAFGNGDKSEK